ncbi:MAG: transcription termination factor NusA [Bacilli bacterium]|nr:transcription termination factor NusA [Bacilli bacterium]
MAINVTELNAAIEQIEVAKGISRETVLEALKEAMTRGFKRDIGGDDAMVEVNIDTEKGIIEMCQIKKVVKEVEDDLLEISVEDANEKGGKYKAGDDYRIPADIQSLRKAIVLSIKSVLHQKFVEVEKAILYDQFKDKIGTMITGKVESFDEHGAMINVGHSSIYMPKKDLIKEERFVIGEPIKVYVDNVETGPKGARIVLTRAGEGFLKLLMTEEIHDIYDGTIVIKSIAREGGERSKVAVYSADPNVDPAGSCIGPNGSRIQKVVSQLGNGAQKEKIDIISYSDNQELFIMDALKPAHVIGINFDEEKKTATVVVKDDSLSLAIGKKGVNVRLAVKLTGYHIDVKIESDSLNDGVTYVTYEEASAKELENKATRIAEKQREAMLAASNATPLPGLPEGYVAPQARKYDDEVTTDLEESLTDQVEKEEISVAPVEINAEEAVETKEEVAATRVAETPKEETPVQTKEAKSVKTTTTLEDLEKQLESSISKEKSEKSSKQKSKKKEETKESEESVVKTEGPRMSIYTEEELKAMEEEDKEAEEEEIEEDDIDYDDYDDYYDK